MEVLMKNHLYVYIWGIFQQKHLYTGRYLLPLSLQTSWLPASLTGDTWSWLPARIMRQNYPSIYSAPFWSYQTLRHQPRCADNVSAFLHRFGCWSIQHSDRGARSNYRIYGLPLTMLGTNQKAGPLPIETREMVGLIKHQKISKNHHRTYMSSFLFEDSLSSCHIMSILHHASIIFQ